MYFFIIPKTSNLYLYIFIPIFFYNTKNLKLYPHETFIPNFFITPKTPNFYSYKYIYMNEYKFGVFYVIRKIWANLLH